MRRQRRDPTEIRLYGTQEAAEYLGIARKNLTEKLRRGVVVEPVAHLACGPIWSESQLDEQLFAWRDKEMGTLDPVEAKRRMLNRRLGILERRWQALVDASGSGDQKKVRAVWEGKAAQARRARGRSALATPHQARRALAEAELIRLVADLRQTDRVFAEIAAELDEAADLRKAIKALEEAGREPAFVAEAGNTHQALS